MLCCRKLVRREVVGDIFAFTMIQPRIAMHDNTLILKDALIPLVLTSPISGYIFPSQLLHHSPSVVIRLEIHV